MGLSEFCVNRTVVCTIPAGYSGRAGAKILVDIFRTTAFGQEQSSRGISSKQSLTQRLWSFACARTQVALQLTSTAKES